MATSTFMPGVGFAGFGRLMRHMARMEGACPDDEAVGDLLENRDLLVSMARLMPPIEEADPDDLSYDLVLDPSTPLEAPKIIRLRPSLLQTFWRLSADALGENEGRPTRDLLLSPEGIPDRRHEPGETQADVLFWPPRNFLLFDETPCVVVLKRGGRVDQILLHGTRPQFVTQVPGGQPLSVMQPASRREVVKALKDALDRVTPRPRFNDLLEILAGRPVALENMDEHQIKALRNLVSNMEADLFLEAVDEHLRPGEPSDVVFTRDEDGFIDEITAQLEGDIEVLIGLTGEPTINVRRNNKGNDEKETTYYGLSADELSLLTRKLDDRLPQETEPDIIIRSIVFDWLEEHHKRLTERTSS